MTKRWKEGKDKNRPKKRKSWKERLGLGLGFALT